MFISFVWFVSILAFLLIAASNKLVAFDESNKLLNAASEMSFDRTFSSEIQKILGSTKNTVVHFKTRNCVCNPTASEHIDSVQQLAEDHDYQNKTITLSRLHELSKVLPATPAVAVFNEAEKLVYLGPYSAGYSCSAGNGIVEFYIEGKSAITPGATVVSNTKGCYCKI